MKPNQLNLFSDVPLRSVGRPETLVMDADSLTRWKTQIAAYQQRTRESQPVQQVTLFDLAPAQVDPDTVDPFSLRLCPMSFYRLPDSSPGDACIYFVIDTATDLILYIGETCRSNKRWKGTHDTKRYLSLYQDLHYRHGLQTAVNIAFWWDVPVDRKPRQELELDLILKWRSPFNKQNWTFWGAPFVG